MSVFDFLKEIPLSAVLREKLKDIEAEVAALKAENLKLRAENDEAQVQNQSLTQKLLPAPTGKLEEVQEFLLRALAAHDEVPEQQVAQMGHIGNHVAAYHLEELRRKKFVHANYTAGSDWSGEGPTTYWSLDHAGRAYLVQNGLIQ